MKFCKVLEGQNNSIPEFNHIVLRYKQLKKKIRAIPKKQAVAAEATEPAPGPASAPAPAGQQPHPPAAAGSHAEGEGAGASPLSPEEQDFMRTLNEDVSRLNTFFMEKEEDAVMNLQTMQDQLEQSSDPQLLNEVKSRLVNFHGELVMILHWSLINYSAIVKILKKHDKRSGVLLRAPYLANVLTQPFSSTNVMSGLVKRAEELVEAAAGLTSAQPKPREAQRARRREEGSAQAGARSSSRGQGSAGAGARGSSRQEGRGEASGRGQEPGSSDDEGSSLTELSGEDAVIKRTKLALEMWHSLAKCASTPSTIPHADSAAAADVSESAPPAAGQAAAAAAAAATTLAP